MKKYLAYLAVCAAIVAAGCTDFGDENQLNLPAAPDAVISNIVAEADGDSITFTVAPAAAAGYYAWFVVKSEITDTTLQAERILKQLETGVAKGIVNYEDKQSVVIGIGGLTPFTVYQIYAVAATPDGVVSAVENINVRTLDDGSKPTPQKVALSDNTVTLTFHEPLKLGTGKVFVSYFAKNTVSGANPLVVAAGFESFNPQNVQISADRLSVDGKSLVIQLSDAPAGAYASITYDAGAVTDLEGNLSSAYTNKADTLISGVPSRGYTVLVANESWALYSEFEEINPDTLDAFTTWNTLQIPAVQEEGISVAKRVATKMPTVVYKESGKSTTINVKTWGVSAGTPVFLLPEEPARGAIIDLIIPAGAFEDVYGNTSDELTIDDNYLYSYGYTLADITGTWQIDGINASTGAAIAPETVLIVADTQSSDPNALLIKNLAKNITTQNSEIEAVFDPVMGKLIVPDWQVLVVDWTHPSAGTADVIFSSSASPEIVFAVTTSGKITSASEAWGYYFAKGENYIGWLRRYATSSQWTRTSTSMSAPVAVKAATIESSVPLLKVAKKFKK